jgi:hypothetical protein
MVGAEVYVVVLEQDEFLDGTDAEAVFLSVEGARAYIEERGGENYEDSFDVDEASDWKWIEATEDAPAKYRSESLGQTFYILPRTLQA